MIFTDQLIEELIKCPKIIVDSPRSGSGVRSGFIKRICSLQSDDNEHNFDCFITQNQTFIENFSVGLSYNPMDTKGKIVLLRVNGSHGGTAVYPHHASPHIHLATAERINLGLRPEGKIIETDKYVTFEEAIQYFFSYINLDANDRRKYFPPPDNQIELFQ